MGVSDKVRSALCASAQCAVRALRTKKLRFQQQFRARGGTRKARSACSVARARASTKYERTDSAFDRVRITPLQYTKTVGCSNMLPTVFHDSLIGNIFTRKERRMKEFCQINPQFLRNRVYILNIRTFVAHFTNIGYGRFGKTAELCKPVLREIFLFHKLIYTQRQRLCKRHLYQPPSLQMDHALVSV